MRARASLWIVWKYDSDDWPYTLRTRRILWRPGNVTGWLSARVVRVHRVRAQAAPADGPGVGGAWPTVEHQHRAAECELVGEAGQGRERGRGRGTGGVGLGLAGSGADLSTVGHAAVRAASTIHAATRAKEPPASGAKQGGAALVPGVCRRVPLARHDRGYGARAGTLMADDGFLSSPPSAFFLGRAPP